LVSGKNKAVRITTDLMGEVLAMGCGSEPMATAAAALKDFEHILASRFG
jgi:homoserine dehydrogenase